MAVWQGGNFTCGKGHTYHGKSSETKRPKTAETAWLPRNENLAWQLRMFSTSAKLEQEHETK
jgi:hypothetical protein